MHLIASVADNLAFGDFVKDFRSVLPKRLRRGRRNTDEAKESDAPANPLRLDAELAPPLPPPAAGDPSARGLLDPGTPETPESP